MIDILFEQRIVQNPALGAEAIWQAVREAHHVKKRVGGVSLPLLFLVLPLVFHRRSALALSSKTQPGALFKALSEDREIAVGMQERMEALSQRTLHSISMGFHSGLLVFDPQGNQEVLPGRQTPPVEHVTDEVRTIMHAAKRIGGALAEMSLVQLATQLKIRF